MSKKPFPAKVWVVSSSDYDQHTIEKVCYTREAAYRFLSEYFQKHVGERTHPSMYWPLQLDEAEVYF